MPAPSICCYCEAVTTASSILAAPRSIPVQSIPYSGGKDNTGWQRHDGADDNHVITGPGQNPPVHGQGSCPMVNALRLLTQKLLNPKPDMAYTTNPKIPPITAAPGNPAGLLPRTTPKNTAINA